MTLLSQKLHLIWGVLVLAAVAAGCGRSAEWEGPTESSTARLLSSRCQVTSTNVLCSKNEKELTALLLPRKVTYEVPLGTPPSGGWPVVLYFQGSLFPGSRAFAAARSDVFGQYELTLTVKALLDAGYAVLAPNALLGGTTFWQTNIPPWSLLWNTSSDHAFMSAIFQAIQTGRFGKLDPKRLYAMGISSGGFMTSRMAVSYPGMFRALVVHSASYATCSTLCILPPLPGDHPPTLFLHGLLDPIVPIGVMQQYRDALARAGHEIQTTVNPTAGHEWIPEAPRAVLDWLDAHP